METKKLNFEKIGDAFCDDEVPNSLEFTEIEIAKLMKRAKEMHDALTLVGGLIMTGYIKEDCVMLDEEGKAIESSHYELTMEVGGSGSVYIRGESKYNGSAKISATAGCITDTTNIGVAFSLKDGDSTKNIHVAYNGPKENDTILIWDGNDFDGASTAPIAIINNDGKLEIRYWQPEDMGCDPTSVVVINPYGVYDIRLASGVELDNIDMAIIRDDCKTLATAKMDEDGETYDIKAYMSNVSEGSFGFDTFKHGELVRSSDTNAKYFSVRDCFFSLLNKVIEQPDNILYIDRSVEEGCPHCDATVELEGLFHAQACPECGEMILPCNICPHMDCDNYDPDMCNTCPIEHEKNDVSVKRFMSLKADERLALMLLLSVEKQPIEEASTACINYLRRMKSEYEVTKEEV